MKPCRHAWLVLIVAAMLAPGARAATVYEQALAPDWASAQVASAYCSPCVLSPGSRMFGSFALDAAYLLDTVGFAAINSTPGPLGRFSVSVWSDPYASGGPVFEATFGPDDYTLFSGSRGFLSVELPAWRLDAGTWWLSVHGIDGGYLQWGGDNRGGDDRRYNNGALTVLPGTTTPRPYYLGFSLGGELAPSPVPIGGTLPLLLAGLASLLAFRRAR